MVMLHRCNIVLRKARESDPGNTILRVPCDNSTVRRVLEAPELRNRMTRMIANSSVPMATALRALTPRERVADGVIHVIGIAAGAVRGAAPGAGGAGPRGAAAGG